jgi:hypothetical protein
MEENERRIKAAGGEFNLLIDSSVYSEFTKLEVETGINALSLLMNYSDVKFFFTRAMIDANLKGKMGFTQEPGWMIEHALQDEGVFTGKGAKFIYKDYYDGTTKTAIINDISAEHYSQILIAQNHHDITLLTNDPAILKNAAMLLSGRLMNLSNMLDYFANETPDPALRAQWEKAREHYTGQASVPSEAS